MRIAQGSSDGEQLPPELACALGCCHASGEQLDIVDNTSPQHQPAFDTASEVLSSGCPSLRIHLGSAPLDPSKTSPNASSLSTEIPSPPPSPTQNASTPTTPPTPPSHALSLASLLNSFWQHVPQPGGPRICALRPAPSCPSRACTSGASCRKHSNCKSSLPSSRASSFPTTPAPSAPNDCSAKSKSRSPMCTK